MKREYTKPSMREVALRSKPLLQTGSNVNVNRNVELNVTYEEDTWIDNQKNE
jgi:hypothetical protein